MKLAKIGLIALCSAMVVLTGCAKKSDNLTIKFNSVTTADTPKGKAIELFKKLVEERSQGKIKVETHHNSTLYKDKEETEALQNGAIQMAAPSLAKFGPMGLKEFELFDLPYLFNDFNDVHKVTQRKK